MRTRFSKFVAFLLLLIFIEKAGLRLFIHDAVHIAVSSKHDDCSRDHFSKLTCDCLEDFFLPFTHTEQIEAVTLFPTYRLLQSTPDTGFQVSVCIFSCLLSGPPSC